MAENRYYTLLPQHLKTKHNRRFVGAAEDTLFEPEDFEVVEGQIGERDGVDQEDLDRDPFVVERDSEREEYQLSVAVVSRADPDDPSSAVVEGAFYPDLVGQLRGNDGLVEDQSRLFSTEWFAWRPPMDPDMWTNSQRYFWTGPGVSAVNGEYITKEPAGSRITVYEVVGNTTVQRTVTPRTDAKGSWGAGAADEWREDSTTPTRLIYRWDGAAWVLANLIAVDDVPTDASAYDSGAALYVQRTGPDYQRPLFYEYSDLAGRWVPRLVITTPTQPGDPVDGMIWEDVTNAPERVLRRYENGLWTQVTTWTSTATMTAVGAGTDGELRYHALDVDSVTDGWQKNNWWRHFDDLGDADRAGLTDQQAIRPILCHWGGLRAQGTSYASRHDVPTYTIYAFDGSDIVEVSDANFGTTNYQGNEIVSYAVAPTGSDDVVLGFPLSLDSNGEILFDVELETQVISGTTPVTGYRYFRDDHTDLLHSIWAPAPAASPIEQTRDSDADPWPVPRNLTDNPDHGVVTQFSKTTVSGHMNSKLLACGVSLSGRSSWRWGDQCAAAGATIIDSQNSLMRVMAFQLGDDLSLPTAIRRMASEYERFYLRFLRHLDETWNDPTYSTPEGTFQSGITAAAVCDKVLTLVLGNREEDGPFWTADMGTYTNADTLEVGVPIAVPPSAARVGAVPAYTPDVITEGTTTLIRTHDGRWLTGTGEDRDLVVQELESRFFAEIPSVRRTETTAASAQMDGEQWDTRHIALEWTPVTTLAPVEEIVADYSLEADPGVDGYTVYSQTGHIAVWDDTNNQWLASSVLTNDVFLNNADSEYYSYSGQDAVLINRYDRAGTTDFTRQELKEVVRAEFERWASIRGVDPTVNTEYSAADLFTWNYSSAGVEDSYRELYRRVYWTDRPHTYPWEIWGYTIEPVWWRTTWVPDGTNTDGTPIYFSGNTMWADLKTGANVPVGVTVPSWRLLNASAPVPVDGAGDLLDPIALNLVDLDGVPESERDDRMAFGHGPTWESFLNSAQGPFARALAGFLLRPAEWTERLWNDFTLTVGGGSLPLWGGSIRVDASTYTRAPIGSVNVHGEVLSDGTRVSNPGINSWVSEYIRLLGGDPKSRFGDVIRAAEPALGWRAGGFINALRTEVRTPTSLFVPTEDVHVLLHESFPVDILYHSGVVVVRDGTGYRVYGYDTSKSYFPTNVAFQASGGRRDLREQFVATEGQTRFDITQFSVGQSELGRFSVLRNGVRIADRHVRRDDNDTFSLVDYPSLNAGDIIEVVLTISVGDPTARARSFVASNGYRFFYLPKGTGVIQNIPYGTYFRDNEDVVQFIIDYGRYLEDTGWRYDDPDTASTSSTWLAVAQRFAEWSLSNRADGEIFADVAGLDWQRIELDFGHVSGVEEQRFGAYPVLDVAGRPIRPESLVVEREGDEIVFRTTESGLRVYGLRLHVTEYEHAVFFSNTTRFDDLIYDPVTALRHRRLLVKTYRSRNWNGRLRVPGAVINGDELLPNFEKQVTDITRYYDAIDQIEDPVKRLQAHALYGHFDRDYLRSIGVAAATNLAYHRGFLQYKGTARPVTAFVRSTRSGTTDFFVNGVWAWHQGDFGYVRDWKTASFRIESDELKDREQRIDFVTTEDLEDTDIEVLPLDRSSPDSDVRWINPPKSSTGQWTFPLNNDLTPRSDLFYRAAFGLAAETARSRLFHWDPDAGLHEPYARSLIDIIAPEDPAEYDTGPSAVAPALAWGPRQVGLLWWDNSTLAYADYRNDSTVVPWGSILTVEVSSATVSAETYTLNTASAHGFTLNQKIRVFLHDDTEYEGVVTQVTDTDTIDVILFELDEPESSIIDTDAPDPAAIDRVTDKGVTVYEWVESTASPSEWEEQVAVETGARVKDPSAPSYVVRTGDVVGDTRYYFWVRRSPEVSGDRDISARVIETRLEDPTRHSVPWFAPLTSSAMVFFMPASRNDDAYELELLVDEPNQDRHSDWLLVPEVSPVREMESEVSLTLLHGLIGEDRLGNSVPSAMFTSVERYGPGRGQIIWRDIQNARSVFLEAANNALRRNHVFSDTSLVGAAATYTFDTGATWWVGQDFQDVDYGSVTPTQVFGTTSSRDTDFTALLDGDFARVTAARTDPTDGVSDAFSDYRWDGVQWVEVRAKNGSPALLDSVFDESDFVSIAQSVLGVLSVAERNRVYFGLLAEMMHQNDDCWWWMRTSFADVGVTIAVGTPDVQPPDELPLILDAFQDSKPYHTKLRDVTTTANITDLEENELDIDDIPVHHIGLFLDRLACDALQDFGHDAEPVDRWEYTFHPWIMPDFGTSVWRTAEILTPVTGVKSYTTSVGVRRPFEYRVRATKNGSDVPVPSHSSHRDGERVRIDFTANPPTDILLHVEWAAGWVEGPTPTLPSSITEKYPWMTPFAGSYEHEYARSHEAVTGSGNDRVVINRAADELTGDDRLFTSSLGSWTDASGAGGSVAHDDANDYMELTSDGVDPSDARYVLTLVPLTTYEVTWTKVDANSLTLEIGTTAGASDITADTQTTAGEYTTRFESGAHETETTTTVHLSFTHTGAYTTELSEVRVRQVLRPDCPNPGERISSSLRDYFVLDVEDYWTPLHATAGGTPTDVGEYGQAFASPPRRWSVEARAANSTTVAGSEVLTLAEVVACDATTESARGVSGTLGERFGVTTVKCDYGSGWRTLASTEWERITRNTIRLTPDPDERLEYSSDPGPWTFDHRVGEVWADSVELTAGVDYTLSNDDRTLTIVSAPDPVTLRVVFRNYAENGNSIRLFYGDVWLKGRRVLVTSYPRSYSIDFEQGNDGAIIFDTTPAWGETMSVTYTRDHPTFDRNLSEVVAWRPLEVADFLADHTTLTSGTGFDDTLRAGDLVINSTDDNVYVWSGSAWSVDHAARENFTYHVRRDGTGRRVMASSWSTVYTVGSMAAYPEIAYDHEVAGGAIGYGSAPLGYTKFRNGWEAAHGPRPSQATDIELWLNGRSGRRHHVHDPVLVDSHTDFTAGFTLTGTLTVTQNTRGSAGVEVDASDVGQSLAFAASTITRTIGSWVDDGYQDGEDIVITGAEDAGNNGTFTISGAPSATVLTVSGTPFTVNADDTTAVINGAAYAFETGVDEFDLDDDDAASHESGQIDDHSSVMVADTQYTLFGRVRRDAGATTLFYDRVDIDAGTFYGVVVDPRNGTISQSGESAKLDEFRSWEVTDNGSNVWYQYVWTMTTPSSVTTQTRDLFPAYYDTSETISVANTGNVAVAKLDLYNSAFGDRLGDQLLLNPLINGTTNWTAQGTTLAQDGDKLDMTETSGDWTGAYQTVTLLEGQSYRARVEETGWDTGDGTIYLQILASDGVTVIAQGEAGEDVDFIATETTMRFAVLTQAAGASDVFYFRLPYLRSVMSGPPVRTWHDAGVDARHGSSVSPTRAPSFFDNGDAGGIHFTSEWNTALDCGATLDNLWTGGGYLLIQGRVLDKDGRLIAKNDASGWYLHLGETDLTFHVDFGTTDGTWTVTHGLSDGDYFSIEIDYSSSAVANDPNIRVNGALIAETETSTPAGSAVDDSSSVLWVGNDSAGALPLDAVLTDVLLIGATPSAQQRADTFYNTADRIRGLLTVA